MKPGERLIVAAAKVAGGAARDWDEFLAALTAYKDEQLNHMAQVTPDKVQVFQGRAQNAIDLVNMFSTCRDKARSILETNENVKR